MFTLLALLGHGTLDMMQHYTRVAQADIEKAHQRASPADNRRLEGGAKGGKGRIVYLGRTGQRTLWRYLAGREGADNNPEAPLFLGKFGRQLNKGVLRQVLVRLGQKAGVKKVHPHRFRHTFAITYLRSGGDVFTLKELLGHSTLDMTMRYARVAQADIALAHRRASPADHWRL